MSVYPRSKPTAIRIDLGTIFVSMELSRSLWLITSLSPRAGERMSKHSVRGGDVPGLLMRLAAVLDSQSVKTTESSGLRGYDAGKKSSLQAPSHSRH